MNRRPRHRARGGPLGWAALGLAAVLAVNHSAADPRRFLERGEEGWFWYADPAPLEEEPVPEPPVPPPAPVAEPDPQPQAAAPEAFSVAWIEAKLPELRRKAIDEPSHANVSAYLYAQRVMMDKADEFTRSWQQVVATDPLLDENNRFPIASSFRSVALRARSEGRRRALRYVAEHAGLFYFFDASCSYCPLQWKVLERLAKRHEFPVRLVSMDGRPLPNVDRDVLVNDGQAQRMNLEKVPAIVLAQPPDTFSVVSQGFLSLDTLETRILLAAEHIGMLPDAILRLADPGRRGILSASDTSEGMRKLDPDDPEQWVAYLRERIGINMGQPDALLGVLPPYRRTARQSRVAQPGVEP